ncbi:MAG: VOC family protein, partial [Candidatus Sericytochromatia bacterium]
MTATVTYTLGRFVWRELFTRDVTAAKRFYGGLFGWTFDDRPMGDWAYTIVKTGDKEIAGIMDLANMPGGDNGQIPANWAVYVSVADVDAAAQKAVAEGGRILGDCHDIPGVGRFAILADPLGANFNLFRQSAGDPDDEMPKTHEFCWEGLMTTDAAKAIPFYEKVVGWGTTTMGEGEAAMPLFTRISHGQPESLASIGPAPEGAPSHWATFVAVDHVTDATAKTRELGGQVLLERTEIPGVGAFAIIQDPAQAVIYLF